MTKNTHTRLAIAICLTTLATSNLPLRAATATADLNTPSLTKDAGNTGTISFYVHTLQDPDGTKIGPNNNININLISNGNPPANPPISENSTARISVPVPKSPGAFKTYSPAVALLNQQKSLMVTDKDLETLNSNSQQFTAAGQIYIPTGATSSLFMAYAASARPHKFGPAVPPGTAAAMSIDPATVPGGASYDYTPVLDAMLQCDTTDESAGVVLYALDSNTFTSSSNLDDFAGDTGEPMDQTLWSLSISAGGPIGSVSDLQIDFEINPLALREISIPGYNALPPDTAAALIDAQIDASLEQPGAFTFSDDSATLSGFQLFSDGTTFTPYAGDVQFAEGINSGVQEIPEPFAPTILIGLIFLIIAPSRAPRRLLQRA